MRQWIRNSVISQQESATKFNSFEAEQHIEEIGEVSFIGDGIARVIGLTNVMAGELVEFSMVRMVWHKI